MLKKVEEQEQQGNQPKPSEAIVSSLSSIPGKLDKVKEVRVSFSAGTKFILIF